MHSDFKDIWRILYLRSCLGEYRRTFVQVQFLDGHFFEALLESERSPISARSFPSRETSRRWSFLVGKLRADEVHTGEVSTEEITQIHQRTLLCSVSDSSVLEGRRCPFSTRFASKRRTGGRRRKWRSLFIRFWLAKKNLYLDRNLGMSRYKIWLWTARSRHYRCWFLYVNAHVASFFETYNNHWLLFNFYCVKLFPLHALEISIHFTQLK